MVDLTTALLKWQTETEGRDYSRYLVKGNLPVGFHSHFGFFKLPQDILLGLFIKVNSHEVFIPFGSNVIYNTKTGEIVSEFIDDDKVKIKIYKNLILAMELLGVKDEYYSGLERSLERGEPGSKSYLDHKAPTSIGRSSSQEQYERKNQKYFEKKEGGSSYGRKQKY